MGGIWAVWLILEGFSMVMDLNSGGGGVIFEQILYQLFLVRFYGIQEIDSRYESITNWIIHG